MWRTYTAVVGASRWWVVRQGGVVRAGVGWQQGAAVGGLAGWEVVHGGVVAGGPRVARVRWVCVGMGWSRR